jgi:riboflavin kinase/FMN adenylyltransferase
MNKSDQKTSLPRRLRGTVRHFKGNGRKLGYPTANIDTSTPLEDGVYFGRADLAEYKQQPALIFIGTPTTVGDTSRRVEAHILDAQDIDYYGLELEISVEKFHRGNKKFESIDELLVAMKSDEKAGRDWATS